MGLSYSCPILPVITVNYFYYTPVAGYDDDRTIKENACCPAAPFLKLCA